MTEQVISQADKNAEEISDRFAFVASLVNKELRRTNGELTESANHIFADMLEEVLEAGNNLDVPLDFEEFFETFIPVLAKAPNGTPLNRVALDAVEEFHEGRWEKSSPAHYAMVCHNALMDGAKPRVMSTYLARTLNLIYCEQMLNGGIAKPKTDITTDEDLARIEDDLDRTHALVERFKRDPQEQKRLQAVIAAQETTMQAVQRALGLLDAAAPTATSAPTRPPEFPPEFKPSLSHPAIKTKFG